jgi:hypothetical protein
VQDWKADGLSFVTEQLIYLFHTSVSDRSFLFRVIAAVSSLPQYTSINSVNKKREKATIRETNKQADHNSADTALEPFCVEKSGASRDDIGVNGFLQVVRRQCHQIEVLKLKTKLPFSHPFQFF